MARVYTATGNLHPWKIPTGTITAPQTAWDLTATSGRLYGGFGAGPNNLAAFHLDQGDSGSQVWRFGTVGNVQAVALTPDGSRLFFGGHLGINNLNKPVCNGKPLRGLASVNPATGLIYCDFVPSLDQNKRSSYEGAWTLATTNSHLWVGGGFIGVSDAINPEPAPRHQSHQGTADQPGALHALEPAPPSGVLLLISRPDGRWMVTPSPIGT